jgi:D-glycero-D-manno-heptose 1,7-bisphosphate phosphatase
MSLPKAVLLDRDGVINFDSPDYILTPDQWRPIPGSLEAIAALSRAGVPVAIVSNQSALGRGMFDAATMEAIHMRMIAAIETAGGRIAHTAYCPHAPEDDCACRKPKPGLLTEALQALGIRDAAQAVMIGDSVRDVEAALAVGVRPVLVRTGYGDAGAILAKARGLVPDIPVYDDLAAAVADLLQEATCA